MKHSISTPRLFIAMVDHDGRLEREWFIKDYIQVKRERQFGTVSTPIAMISQSRFGRIRQNSRIKQYPRKLLEAELSLMFVKVENFLNKKYAKGNGT